MSDPRVWRFVATCCVCIAATFSSAWGVVNGVPIVNADRRFDAVGLLFTVTPWSACGGWVSGTCTLIAPNVVLIARHCLDINTSQPLPPSSLRRYRVRFRRATDGTSENALSPAGNPCHGVYQEIDIVLLVDAQNTTCDQVLGYLASVPEGIQPIILSLNNPPRVPTPIILAGWGYDGECFGGGVPWTLRSARGIMPSNSSGNDFLAFSWCSVGVTAPCLQCPTIGGPYVNANLHDSGAPVLMEVPSNDPLNLTPELRLIGTVSSSGSGRRPSSWNNSGGLPMLVESTSMPHLRAGDFNGDGVVGVDDVVEFLNAFLASHLDADADANGVLEVADVLIFIEEWFKQ